MAAEGAIAIIAAILAGSVALLGFGLDSAIEGLASVIVVWRFTGTRTLSETAETRAQKAVAVTFFLLAPYIAYDAAATLITRSHAETSWLGIGLSIASLIVMPALGLAKRRLGARLGSAATAGEGTQNLLCAYLAAAVLAGLLANTVLGWWWLDPVVALGIAAVQAPSPDADIVHTSTVYFIGPGGTERYLAEPMADHTSNGTAYLPAGQIAAWGRGIALVAKTLTS
jgi:divalent metal cation (Fe/Co/Zn/Cd) transporter